MPEETAVATEQPATTETTSAATEQAWHETLDWKSSGYEPSDKIREFKSIPDLAKSYDSLRKDNSKKIRIPSEGAKEEEVAAFKSTLKSHLGLTAPESPDKYSFKPSEDMVDYFPDLSGQLKEFHEAGLPDETVSMFLGKQAEAIKSTLEAIKEKQVQIAADAEEALRAKWGTQFDLRLASVNKLKEKYPEAIDDLTAVGLGNTQSVIEMLDDVARSIREDRPEGDSSATNDDARKQLAKIKEQPKNQAERLSSPYFNGRHPDHAATMKQVMELQRQIHGS
jgi:hypothetical protein